MVAFSSSISERPIVNTIVVGRIIEIFEHTHAIVLQTLANPARRCLMNELASEARTRSSPAQFAGRLEQHARWRLWYV
jgi:hypothetical protein